MKRRYKKKPKYQRSIAIKRIRILFEQAEKQFAHRPELSIRYVKLARRIGMRYKVKIPQDLKWKFCRRCSHFLYPGKNCRIRITKGKLVYYCQYCRNFRRFPLK